MKRIISIITAVCLSITALSGTIFAAESDKTEVDYIVSDWAAADVDRAAKLGIPGSFPSGRDLTQPITREMFCEAVFNLTSRITYDALSSDPDLCKFTDVDNDKVTFLCGMGIINGKSETEFAPNDSLTREEAATISLRMINKVKPMPATTMWFNFTDSADISDWAMDAVQTICNMGFMNGVGDNRFAPKDTYTEEQALLVLMRIYDAAKAMDAANEENEETQIYSFDTPLGTVTQTSEYCNSWINFGVETEAIVTIIKDRLNYSESYINVPVKVITNQDTTEMISFDDFAKLFGGEWKLNENKFEFTYDPSVTIELSDEYTPFTYEKPVPSGDAKLSPVIYFADMDTVIINGEETELLSMNGGKIRPGSISMYNGSLYISVQMVAYLMGWDLAFLTL